MYNLWGCNADDFIFIFRDLLCFKHYTKDADGLCTRLIKPKLEEGTVAAQDEFSRSKSQFVSPLQFCNCINVAFLFMRSIYGAMFQVHVVYSLNSQQVAGR